ncbi:hypothetical protein ABFS82_09G056200 [Erythranthe guttata]
MASDESIFSRSFSEYELKKLGCVALTICFITTFSFCTILRQPVLNLEVSVAFGLKMLIGSDKIEEPSRTLKPIYNLSNSRSEVLELNGDIRIHGSSSTIFVASNLLQEDSHSNWTLQPYARKADVFVMQYIKKWSIKHHAAGIFPICHRNFSIPAVVFSTGGYAGNQFHDFTDLLIPLYLTSQPFNRTVLFLITDKRYSWIFKYKEILNKLSKYEVVNIDKKSQVMCFPKLLFGLKSHKEFGINPSEFPYHSINDFRNFLRNTYSLERETIDDYYSSKQRPRMLIVSRNNTRFLKNEGEVGNMARGLGFEVVVREIEQNISLVAKFVNSFDVIMGVHGAGLTNMVFLPDNAVVVEIVPFGLENLAEPYFRIPSKEMKLRYLEYKVSLNESSLLGKYADDSVVYRDPGGLQKKGFLRFRSVYLDNQDVSLDCGRFRDTLLQALEILKN